ncbi:MAG: ABC transporter ATP-binding protein [Chloroflexota bacterium]
MKELIQIKDLKKVYQSKSGPIHALGPINLSIREGEFISIVGPSGCGKSTLLLLVGGLLDYEGGEIRINGNLVKEPQTDIGIVFQTPVLVDWRDVLGNVMLQIEMRGLKPEAYLDKARVLLRSVGLSEFEKRYPFELSGGMQQRAAFCRALIHNPPLVLMDEPLGALDAITREQLRVDLEQLWLQTKKTVLFVTHSIPESVQLSDRVVVFTPRPGVIAEEIEIKLPRPRTIAVRESAEFQKYVHQLTSIFMGFGVLKDTASVSTNNTELLVGEE